MAGRIIALFAGSFTAMNLAGNLLRPGFDGSRWWICFGTLPEWLCQTLLALFAITMLRFALRTQAAPRDRLTLVVSLIFAAIAAVNAIGFYWLDVRGIIAAGFPVPLSFLVVAGLLVVARSAWRTEGKVTAHPWRVLAGAAMLFVLFPVALMLFFGNTDYRRPSEVGVVFGARVYANGRMSDALEDRIRTACELYRAGLVKRLILSGGRGDGAITEASAMRVYALAHGVPADKLIIDNSGFNTEATVRDTVPLFRQWGATRILAISHFYHLPRIKLAYQRDGFEVCTVPARQGHLLRQMPFDMAREVAAFWSYYLGITTTTKPAMARG